MAFERYGAFWPDGTTDLQVERACIRKGGTWVDKGKTCGNGLFHHYHALQKIIWPWKAWHRWNLLGLENLVNNWGTGFLGPASSGKTHEVAAYILSDYWCFPENTTSLVSSTTLGMLELRIWGEIKKLYGDGKTRHPSLPGHLNESKHRITTAPAKQGNIGTKKESVRDFRNGIQGIACNKGGSYVGLSNYAGIKNTRVRIAGDEAQFMPKSFIDTFNNLSHTPRDFKAIVMGNPKDPTDALGIFCEPKGGWDTMDRTEKTKTWDAKMLNVRVVQLVGTDSPNYDFPDGQEKYPYLIKRSKINEHRIFYGPNSIQFAMMDLGMMPITGVGNRVITVRMCDEHRAKDTAIFEGAVTKVIGLDAAYGGVGGDRCVAIEAWFGNDIAGKQIFAQVGNPIIIPVSFKNADTPENQITKFIQGHCVPRGIDPANVFFDSTGRGTLGTAFGRLWSTDVNPVEFGGRASDRPVSSVDRRPCSEAYGKFVTELWYQVRTAIEANQIRGMTADVIEEGSMREYMMIDGKRIDVEPKKLTKERMGSSPDLFDAWVVAFEGARRRGFVIARSASMDQGGPSFWNQEADKFRSLVNRRRLKYASA
jgi:hypothetical protein